LQKAQKIKLACDELFSKSNLNIVEEIFSVNYIAHSDNKKYTGQNFVKKFNKELHFAIDKLEVKEIVFFTRTNDTIVWQRTLSGIHKNNMRGIPPSGKKIQWNEMVVTHYEKDIIIEEWIVSELLGKMLVQIPKK